MFNALVAQHRAPIDQFLNGQIDELPDAIYEAFFDYYCANGEMPYGTAKARTGDPHKWVHSRLKMDIVRQTKH